MEIPEVIVIDHWHSPSAQTTELWPVEDERVELFWLPVLGPSALLLIKRLAKMLRAASPVTLETDELAYSLGMRRASGPLFSRSFKRCVDFQFIRQLSEGNYLLRTAVPALSDRQGRRLPPALRDLKDNKICYSTYCDLAGSYARLHQLSRTLVNLGLNEQEVLAELERYGYTTAQARYMIKRIARCSNLHAEPLEQR
jgi:hypothetical protein